MALVERGISRQDAHEEIRVLSHQAAAMVKQEGKDNDLLARVKITPFFKPIIADLERLTDASTFIGRSPEIVQKLVEKKVKPALARYEEQLKGVEAAELSV